MEKEKLVSALQLDIEARKTKGSSYAQTAKIAGCSPATITQLMANSLDGISVKMLRKIASELGVRLENTWDIVATPVLNSIKKSCDEAKENSRMIGIIAATGQGKTTALRLYEQKNANTYYVLCNVLMSRITFLKAIAKAIGVVDSGSSIELLNRITSRLNSTETPLLILDDFGKVKDSVYQMLQLIYDECEGTAGIVVAGVPYLKEYIKKKTDTGKFCFPELSRRIAYWQVVKPISKAVVGSIAQYNGIIDPSAVEYIQKTATNMGQLKEIIISAKKVAENITIETLQIVTNHE
jgi:DNA transposition AAA+ family ATPase